MFITTTFSVSYSNRPLITDVKLKGKLKTYMATIFVVSLKKIGLQLQNLNIFQRSITIRNFGALQLIGTIVTLTSQVCIQ